MAQDVFDDLWETPLEIQVLDKAVVIIGPDGVTLAMTADAAEASAHALAAAAAKARTANQDS